jgi:aryl-alcohol dehydrogenase-like predicted oxidoreductase
MRRRILGATGWSVSEFALGTMMFGAMGNTDHDDSVRIIRSALDSDINFLDTADVYSLGESEEIVGKALAGRRDDVVLATKFGLPFGDDPDKSGGSRRWIVREVENSLRRLGTDYIDLYQIHRYDYDTKVDETLLALDDLVRAGKVRAIGSSSFPAENIVEAQWAAERRGTHRFLTEQPRYSIFNRALEGTIFPTIQKYGMGALTYSPLNGGWLSGRPHPETAHRAVASASFYDPEAERNRVKLAAVDQLSALAANAGLTLPQLAIGFVGAHPAVTSVIIGPRTQEQLDGLLTAVDLELPPDVLDRIDEIVPSGTDLAYDMYRATPPALTDKALRRR